MHDRRAHRQLVGQSTQGPLMLDGGVEQVRKHRLVALLVGRGRDACQISAQVGVVVDFGDVVHIVIIVFIML